MRQWGQWGPTCFRVWLFSRGMIKVIGVDISGSLFQSAGAFETKFRDFACVGYTSRLTVCPRPPQSKGLEIPTILILCIEKGIVGSGGVGLIPSVGCFSYVCLELVRISLIGKTSTSAYLDVGARKYFTYLSTHTDYSVVYVCT